MINITYDVDGVLNNLTEHVLKKLNIEENKIVYYNIWDNNGLLKEQKEAILKYFNTPQTFRELQLVEGAENILDIEETGKAKVNIYSANLNEEILSIKTEKLVKHIKNMSYDRINMICIGLREQKKPIDTDIIVEDSLQNILMYNKKTKRILIDKHYNKFETYNINNEEENIIRARSLLEANSIIKSIVLNELI